MVAIFMVSISKDYQFKYVFFRCKKNTSSTNYDLQWFGRLCQLEHLSFSLYLVDPASIYMLVSKIKPCISVHGQYNETADSSLNQLWFLVSLDHCNWITASYNNHYRFVFRTCSVSLCYTMS